MQILRKYQLDVIFLFFALILLAWTEFYALRALGADPHDYEWLAMAPLLAFYVFFLAKIRGLISLSDRRALTGKTLAYWVALGVTLFASYSTPISASEYWSLDAFFLAFTLFLADSYWDFTGMTVKSIVRK